MPDPARMDAEGRDWLREEVAKACAEVATWPRDKQIRMQWEATEIERRHLSRAEQDAMWDALWCNTPPAGANGGRADG